MGEGQSAERSPAESACRAGRWACGRDEERAAGAGPRWAARVRRRREEPASQASDRQPEGRAAVARGGQRARLRGSWEEAVANASGRAVGGCAPGPRGTAVARTLAGGGSAVLARRRRCGSRAGANGGSCGRRLSDDCARTNRWGAAAGSRRTERAADGREKERGPIPL